MSIEVNKSPDLDSTINERDFESRAGFLETMAEQVSAAINNARIYEDLKKTEQNFRNLFKMHPADFLLMDIDLGGGGAPEQRA
jgi:GAF domain-containing protein